MTTQIEQLTNFLNDNGFKARPWREFRVYLNNYGKDIKAYIELDEPTAELGDDEYLFNGCALRVFSNAAQSRAWLINRAKQVKHGIMCELDTVNDKSNFALFGEKVETCENWQDVIL